MSTKRGHKGGFSGGASNNGKPSPANAWARPLQSKTGPPPGMGGPSSASARSSSSTAKFGGSKPNSNGASLSMIHRERLLHLSLSLVGQNVTVTQTNGAIMEGIFHTFTPFSSLSPDMKNRYVFNAVKVVKHPPSSEDSVTVKDGSTVIIPADKVVYVKAKNVSLDRPATNGGPAHTPPGMAQSDVMTDTQISGSRGGRDRALVAAGTAWTAGGSSGGNSRAEALAPSAPRSGGGGDLRGKGLQGSIGEWDQFKANEELFNVNASYDENLYTTELDKSQIDSRKVAEAERLAREIENTTSSNIHIAEERGHALETDFDEEDRYSGVLTKEGKNRHETAPSKEPAEPLEPVAEGSKETPPAKSTSVATTAPKMNYAAAAAKADAGKKGPPGFAGKTSATVPSTPSASDVTPPEKVATVTPDAKKDEPETKNDEVETTAPSKSTEPQPDPEVKKETEEKENEKAIKAETEESKKPEDSTEAKTAPAPAPAPASPAEKPESAEKPKEDVSKTKDGKASSDSSTEAETKRDEKDKKSDVKEVAKTSKLNANAKAFSFNPNAKTFTPTFGGGSSTADTQPQQQQQHPPQQQHHQAQQMPDMHAVQMHPGGHPMQQQPHYMHAPMQPGMMPMMNPQFQGMRYPAPYGGMEQNMGHHMQQPHQQPPPAPHSAPAPPTQAAQPVAASSSKPTPNDDENAQQQGLEGDSSQQPAAPQQPQAAAGAPPQMQVQYGPPPGAYFAGQNMAMHPRGPGFSPPFVGAPQQIPVGPGSGPYRYPMQPGSMPPTMHMRGPGGSPYYPGPNGPMHYNPGPYGMADDNEQFRGRGGRGGRGRGRGRNNNRGGRGRGGPGPGRGYQSYHGSGSGSGRSTPHQNPSPPVGEQQGGPATDGNTAGSDPSSKPVEAGSNNNS